MRAFLILLLGMSKAVSGMSETDFAAAHNALLQAGKDYERFQGRKETVEDEEECRPGKSSEKADEEKAEEAAKYNCRKIFCEAIEGPSLGTVSYSFSLQAQREVTPSERKGLENAQLKNEGSFESCNFALPPITFKSVTVSNEIKRLPDGTEYSSYQAAVIGCVSRSSFRNLKFTRRLIKLKTLFQNTVKAENSTDFNLALAELNSSFGQLRIEFGEPGFKRSLDGLEKNLLTPLDRVAAGEIEISISGTLKRIKPLLPDLQAKSKKKIQVIYNSNHPADKIRTGIPLLQKSATQWIEDFKDLSRATAAVSILPRPDIISISLAPPQPSFKSRLSAAYLWFKEVFVKEKPPPGMPKAKLKPGKIRLRAEPSVRSPVLAGFFSNGEELVFDPSADKTGWRRVRMDDGTWAWLAMESFEGVPVVEVRRHSRLYPRPFRGAPLANLAPGTRLLVLETLPGGFKVYYAYSEPPRVGWIRKEEVKKR